MRKRLLCVLVAIRKQWQCLRYSSFTLASNASQGITSPQSTWVGNIGAPGSAPKLALAFVVLSAFNVLNTVLSLVYASLGCAFLRHFIAQATYTAFSLRRRDIEIFPLKSNLQSSNWTMTSKQQLSLREKHPEFFIPDSNIDRRGAKRTVPMEVLNLGMPRTGTACTSFPCTWGIHITKCLQLCKLLCKSWEFQLSTLSISVRNYSVKSCILI